MYMVMKKLLLILFLTTAVVNLHGQITSKVIENMMADRRLTPENVAYNAVSLLPDLYREGRTDTINAVISYWYDKCGVTEPLLNYAILEAIRTNTFHEEIRFNEPNKYDTVGSHWSNDFYADYIISGLQWYAYGSNIRSNPKKYAPINHTDLIVSAYARYYDFLRSLALDLCEFKDLSPVESYLVHYYAYPDSNRMELLKDTIYNGSVIQEMYGRRHKNDNKIPSRNFGAYLGSWVPNGNLKVIGVHPTLGILFGKRWGKWMTDLDMMARLGESPQYYTIKYNDSLFQTKKTIGIYMGIDGAFELMRTKQVEVDILAGMGYDAISSSEDKNIQMPMPSFNFNFGLGYRIFIPNKEYDINVKCAYLNFQLKYNLVNYNNPGGTLLSGNALTASIIYGAFGQPKNKQHE